MKIVPFARHLPDHLQSLVGSVLHKPADGVNHDFVIKDPFLSLYERGLIPPGSHLEEQVEFAWTEPLKQAVSGKTKSGRFIWELIPSGPPLPNEDVFLHKRFAASSLTDEDARSHFEQHAIPLHAILGLLITLDPTIPCRNSPLSGVVENFIATRIGEDFALIRVQFNSTGHEKKWIIFPPAKAIPNGKVILFRS